MNFLIPTSPDGETVDSCCSSNMVKSSVCVSVCVCVNIQFVSVEIHF